MTAHDRSDCGTLREHVDLLAVSLAQWAYRDDTRAQPQVRQAANHAIEAIDAAQRELTAIRARLVGEIRQADDAAMHRSGELLDRIRDERKGDPS